MMGQPILGDRGNIKSVTRDMIVNYHDANYFGENIIIVGAGDVSHAHLVELANKHFSNCAQKPPEGVKRKGMEKPIYNPGLMMIRDDEMINSCVGVFYDAPSWMHYDYYPFLLLERIFGSYQAELHADMLNDVKKQYNSVQGYLGKFPDVIKQQAIYSPYVDCGLFGNYFMVNEAHTKQMNYCGLHFPTKFVDHIDKSEIVRAKQKLYHDLTQIETTADVMQSIGQQVLYWNRRVPRSEIAIRIANITVEDIKRVCYEYFYDAVLAFA